MTSQLVLCKLSLNNYTSIFTNSQTGVKWHISNFELPLLNWNSSYVAQILCGLSYKVWPTFITKLGTICLLDTSLTLYTSCLVAMLWQHQRLVYNFGSRRDTKKQSYKTYRKGKQFITVSVNCSLNSLQRALCMPRKMRRFWKSSGGNSQVS